MAALLASTLKPDTWIGLTLGEWAGCVAAAVAFLWALDTTLKVNIAYRRTGGDPKEESRG